MAYTGAVHRWDMYWADLEPGVGSEQKGERRPVIVVSNDGYNAAFSVVTIVSATKAEGKKRRIYPFEVLLPVGMITAANESIVMPHQVRTISKTRLLERIGTLEDESFREQIENRLLEHLGIAFEEESLDGVE
ncbi:MAG TPA: type II toxin-antitoxin system PemK/MazF family toxin [Gemmatimonadaceae bacterium]|nr:type II toxin-antitoxin system PemK/MazF family toxin [Gemmatimonadaceae bacterium]